MGKMQQWSRNDANEFGEVFQNGLKQGNILAHVIKTVASSPIGKNAMEMANGIPQTEGVNEEKWLNATNKLLGKTSDVLATVSEFFHRFLFLEQDVKFIPLEFDEGLKDQERSDKGKFQ